MRPAVAGSRMCGKMRNSECGIWKLESVNGGKWPSVAPNLADAGVKGLTLLCSVSVNLAELWRAPSKGGEGNFEIRPYDAPNPLRGGASKGFRDSGVKGLRGQVEGGRWKRGLSLFHWASGLKVTG